MIVYRIANSKYSADLSGGGAEKAGGRWNSKGFPVLYTSQSRALAAMELAVHIPFGLLPANYKIISLYIPESFSIFEIDQSSLPENWKQYPFSAATQKIGNEWLQSSAHPVCRVPSVIIEDEFNFLINPLHSAFYQVKILDSRAFEFDLRLQKP